MIRIEDLTAQHLRDHDRVWAVSRERESQSVWVTTRLPPLLGGTAEPDPSRELEIEVTDLSDATVRKLKQQISAIDAARLSAG